MANIQDSGKMIVMELAKGGELGEYLEKTGKMTEEKAKGRKIPGADSWRSVWSFWMLDLKMDVPV